MKNKVKAVIFDIDGVITDGKKYTDGISQELKSLSYKDLDAIKELQQKGFMVGCISGEDTTFSRQIATQLDFYSLGSKNKKEILEQFSSKYKIDHTQICYIGDGKYDIEALKYAGISVCPKDAIYEVKKVSDIILETFGGEGCIAELYEKLQQTENRNLEVSKNNKDILDTIKLRVNTHNQVVDKISKDSELLSTIKTVCHTIINSYKNNGQLFLCGNGGSAADAQHIAAELVGRFYLERKAYPAEALSTNVPIITALANDYDYNMIFARQIEAKGHKGDVLIGITTSGKSANIQNAFRQAKDIGMSTVLMTGDIHECMPIIEYTDYLINIPSNDTPRVQEGHILIGHILCEIIESKLTGEKKDE